DVYKRQEQDTSKDELGELTQSYNNMITAIKRLIIQVHQSAATVADKTNTIASSAQQALVMSQSVSRALEEAASGACNQAEDTVACTDKMVQLSNAINGVTVDIQQTQEIIEKTVILSKHAAYILSDLNENARSADNSSVNIVNDIKGLNDDMKEILSIVKLIGSISEQTNMLALNASIEAARAGQAGLGFAVVAEEVKKLADQSKAASGSINGIIGRIIKRAGNAVDTANQTRDSMNRQMLAVDNTDAAFERINGAMLDLSGHMEDIKAEVARMLDIKESTVAAIENISSVSQQTAARSQEASSNTTEQILGAKALSELAFELSSISEGLEAAVSQFKF
ncbi:MAG: methyl-accepting chemotaxis protein, partial [Clostridia bacterium]|nr:methyl-accepting chemotaxis protein [Clostridia bacterium]